jgi:hypothetical protein
VTTILFGLMGYLMKRFGIEPATLILAFVLGPMLENNLSKALIMSRTGNPLYFFSRPISATLLSLAILSRPIPGAMVLAFGDHTADGTSRCVGQASRPAHPSRGIIPLDLATRTVYRETALGCTASWFPMAVTVKRRTR